MLKNVYYITDERGNRVSVVLPIKQWQQVLDELEELDDIRLYDGVKARNELTMSLAEYRRERVFRSPSGAAYQ
jgi:hypothetical protein